jgi:hypothetical protein
MRGWLQYQLSPLDKWPPSPLDKGISSTKLSICAQMAELVDAPASGAGGGFPVEVRVFFWAPFFGFFYGY